LTHTPVQHGRFQIESNFQKNDVQNRFFFDYFFTIKNFNLENEKGKNEQKINTSRHLKT